jgi:ribosomal protein L40E
MAERNAVKARQCRKCKKVLRATAKDIKQHAAACDGQNK